MWARLAVFTGGFELDAVEGVCSDEELPSDDVLDVVASLVDRSVLGREEYGSQVRYRMLETIRQYGQEKLEDQGEEDTWRRRHRDWYADLAARAEADWISPRQVEWVARLRREHANLRAALEFSVADPKEAGAAMRIASSLEHHWVARGTLSEARHWLDRALAHPVAAPVERARALRLDAWLAVLQSDTERRGPAARRGEAVGRRCRGRRRAGLCAAVIGHACDVHGGPELCRRPARPGRGDVPVCGPHRGPGPDRLLARHEPRSRRRRGTGHRGSPGMPGIDRAAR